MTDFVIPDSITPVLSTPFEMVGQFHEVYDMPGGEGVPSLLDEDRASLRIKLIEEELEELKRAVEAGDLVEILDALGDLIYVVNGFSHELYVDLDDIVRIIQLSNLTKLNEDGNPIHSRGIEEDGYPKGKVLKGPNYQEPTVAIREYLIQRGWVPESEL